jgi:hypothetical protein
MIRRTTAVTAIDQKTASSSSMIVGFMVIGVCLKVKIFARRNYLVMVLKIPVFQLSSVECRQSLLCLSLVWGLCVGVK